MITLATLEKATVQEVFDQIVNHLREQKVPSADDSGDMCMYRKEKDGVVLKCAAGCLIADNEYNPNWEDVPWGHLRVPNAHKPLITDLQMVHDSGVDFWESGFQRVAIEYNLQHTPKPYDTEV